MSDYLDRFFANEPEPTPPKKKRRKKTPKKDLEHAVQTECIKLLASNPYVLLWERRNTGMVFLANGTPLKFGIKGRADLWCVAQLKHKQGVAHVEIECKKRSGGRLSQAQKDFQTECECKHIPYLVVTSAVDLAIKMNDIGVDFP